MRVVSLNEICDLQNGYAFKSNDYVTYSNTLNCRMSNIRPDGKFNIEYAPKYLPDDFVEKYADFLLKDGDLVIAMTDMANDPKILGVPTIVDTKGKKLLLNQRVGKLILLKEDVVDLSFLQYSLNRQSVKKYYTQFAGGGLQLNVGKKEILSVKIPLPPLDQQKKIASILDAADAYRQKTKALISKYDELTQSLFLDMFGDPVKNEKGWEKLKLSEFCEFENGDRSSNYPSGNDIKNSGKLFLSSGDIQNGRFRVKDSKYISQEKFDSLKRGKCRTGDVLMTLRGNGTGKSAVFNCEFKEGFINAQMVILRPDNRCLSDYLVLQLNSLPVFKRLINLNSGSAQPQLSASNVKDFEVFVPDIELQNQFAERVQAIEQQKAKAQESLEKAEELFNSLLQKAFNGELVEP